MAGRTKHVNIEVAREISERVAEIAATLMDIQKDKYILNVICDPTMPLDGMADIERRSITVNVAKLSEYANVFPTDNHSRIILEIIRVTAHEMRHIYQWETLRYYIANKKMRRKNERQTESDETCETWLRELSCDEPPGVDSSIERDARAFADYVLEKLELVEICNDEDTEEARDMRKRMADMRKKYNDRNSARSLRADEVVRGGIT